MFAWLFLALAAAAVFWFQRQEAELLRTEVGLLHEENRELARLRDENRRLAATLPTPEVVTSLQADHAAVARLRSEVAALQASLAARERALAK